MKRILEKIRRLPGTQKALLVQTIAFFGTGLCFIFFGSGGLLAWPWVSAQAVVACGLAKLFNSDRWWLGIHLSFFPLAVLLSQFQVAPVWYLLGFILLALVYGSHFRSQVPLFLSNSETTRMLLGLVRSDVPVTFLDFGSGLGGVVRTVAKQRPLARCVGVEGAFLPAISGRLLSIGQNNCDLQWGDFWKTHLGEFDVVYAFLSPVPMPALWAKACAEMRKGSLLVSNSFVIPNLKPKRIIEVGDRRKTRLFVYVLS
ncbi:MAG: class I SAM-dependent methyltransferase [Burkholderiales bacterium]|nr:class I SAM-dependent methyltransferase [Burkholderiales bacterium]